MGESRVAALTGPSAAPARLALGAPARARAPQKAVRARFAQERVADLDLEQGSQPVLLQTAQLLALQRLRLGLVDSPGRSNDPPIVHRRLTLSSITFPSGSVT
jgi:hypothetical protein